MRHPCVNPWCPSKVEREGRKCGPCLRSAERTSRLMARVDEKAKARRERWIEEQMRQQARIEGMLG